jgi:hypothetical protein
MPVDRCREPLVNGYFIPPHLCAVTTQQEPYLSSFAFVVPAFGRMGLVSMLSTMLQRTGNWAVDSLRLLKAVALAHSSGQRRLTLLQYASLVLRNKLPPEQYETAIDGLMQEDRDAQRDAAQREDVKDVSLSSVDDMSANETLSIVASLDETSLSSGRLWYQVIEQPVGKDPFVVGLFLDESEAVSCQKIHEELAIKKSSRSSFATEATVKA